MTDRDPDHLGEVHAIYNNNRVIPRKGFPEIVCLCGSTKFVDHFTVWMFRLTLDGKIVLTIGTHQASDSRLAADGMLGEGVKEKLDELHKRKIDLADRVFVLNVGGYIGESTRSEIEYAKKHNKKIDYLEKP